MHINVFTYYFDDDKILILVGGIQETLEILVMGRFIICMV